MKSSSVGAKPIVATVAPRAAAATRANDGGRAVSGGRARARVPVRPVAAHPPHQGVDASADREQEEHPSALVRAPLPVFVFVFVLHALLEQVEDPVMLGP